jgi:alkylation response protein AidB-like acyl-CoA dehydrogenase
VTDAPTSEQLLEAAHELAPAVRSYADRIESERRLPPEYVATLRDAGLFRMTVPRSLGGSEVTVPAFREVMETLAMADASTAWVIGQNAGIGRSAAFLPRKAAEEIFGDPDCRVAWGPGPASAVRVEGGYRLNLQCSFASGIRHATWIGSNGCGVVDESGAPSVDADGSQQRLTLFFPAQDAELLDTWHVSGLRGTASDTYVVKDLFVPLEHTMSRDSERTEPGPLYSFSNNGIFNAGFASVGLGIARSALDSFLDLAITKTPRGFSGPLREAAGTQSRVAEAEGVWQSARLYLIDRVAESWRAALAGKLDLDHRIKQRLAVTHAIKSAASVVDTAYYLAGATAIFQNNAFERRFRDMHAVTQQMQGRWDHYETVGRAMLGLDFTTDWI